MIWRTAFWMVLGAVVIGLLLWVFLGMAAAANAVCGDVLFIDAWPDDGDADWTWWVLGRMDDGSVVFVLRSVQRWEVVTVRDNRACLVLAGGPA